MHSSSLIRVSPCSFWLTAQAPKLSTVVLSAWLLLVLAGGNSQAQTSAEEISFSRLQQAITAISEGNLRQAKAILTAVLASRPRDADALNLLGVVRAQQHRFTEGERLLRRALGVVPTHVGAHINLAELYVTLKRPEQAKQLLLAGHKLAPARADINVKLATLYEEEGDHQEALRYLDLVPREDASPDYFNLLLKTLLKLNRLEDARKLAAEFKKAPIDSEATMTFAMLLAAGGLTEEALTLLEDALSQSSASYPLLYALGVVNSRIKRYDKAEDYLLVALKAKPADVATLRALAQVARTSGNLEKALAYLLQARRVSPDTPEVLYDFAATALKMGLILDALPAFQRLNDLYPRQPAYVFGLAAARLRKGELEEAERLSRIYMQLRPLDGSGYYLRGAALHLLNRQAEAQDALEHSLRLMQNPQAEYLLGLTLYEQGKRVAAIERLRTVVQAHPEHAAAQATLGTALSDAGNYAEARIALERSVQIDPDDLRANYQLGLVYSKLGEKEAAKRMFARADELRASERQRESVILKLIEPPEK